MKLRQRMMALATAICLLVMMVPLTGRAAGEIRSKTLRVQCDGQAVSGASITVELQSINGDRTLLGTSNSGELTLSSDLSDTEGKTVEVTITLPDGYEYAHAPADQRVLKTGYEPEGFFNNGTGVWNVLRSKQGEALFLSMNHMDMSVGSSIDISGAFQDSFVGSSPIQLYFQAQDGTKTQVACDRLVEENNPVYTKSSENPNLLRMTQAGTSKLTFYYGEYEATLTIVVENTNTQLPPDYNESRDVFHYSVTHNGEVMKEAKLRVLLENGEDSIVWLTSDTGEIEFSRESEELKNFKCLTIAIILPEGYQFLSYGYMGNESSISYDMQGILDDRYDYSGENCQVANPAVDGTLQIPETYLSAKIGDVIDLSGAFDLNAEEFPMYFIAPDGNRSRVVCDDYANFQDNPGYRMDGYKLTITDYGTSYICFYYKNSMAMLEIYVPDPEAPPTYVEISDNEGIYIYPDGRENRVIYAEDDIYFASIEGDSNQLPTGSRFESKAVAEGEIFNKAKEAVKKNFNTENLRVFEMNLWDWTGAAIHQLSSMMAVTIKLPEDFQLADGKLPMMYRLEENGTLTRCDTKLTNGWLTFQTNHFSTYILAGVNENEMEPKQNAVNTDSAMKSPKTADTTSSAGWAAVMVFAVVALAFVTFKAARKEEI